jgi:uncharacterized membrane protein
MAKAPSPPLSGSVLPPPEILEHYERVHPGFAERILAAFEKQGEHRRSMEEKALLAQVALARRGQVFGFCLGLTALAGGTLAAALGAQWAGAFIGGGGVVGLVSVFVLGQRSRAPPGGGNRVPAGARGSEET